MRKLNSGLSSPGSSPGQGHCSVFLGKILYSHSAFLHVGEYKSVLGNLMLGVTLQWTSILFKGEVLRVFKNTLSCFLLQKPEISTNPMGHCA